MSDRDFKKFLEEVQVSAVSDVPMPRMSDKKPSAVSKQTKKATALAGSKRVASRAVSTKTSAA